MDFQKKVAYFVSEIAVDDSLKTYAGGLGFVAGSFLRAAYRNGAPIIGITILWRNGFYDQRIGPDGMEIGYISRDYSQILEDTGARVKIQISENPNVWIKIWQLKPEIFKTAPIYYLDADISENDELSRENTKNLYSSDSGRRLVQLIILGIGGVRALQELQIPVDIYHLNEGYTVLAAIELLSQKVAKGLNFTEALNEVKKQVVFTTHTSEVAGEGYDLDFMIRMGCFPGLNWHQATFLGGGPFNLTAAALRLAGRFNAVSWLHAETNNRMWAWLERRCQIIPITNGMDVEYWQFPEFGGEKTLEEIMQAKAKHKRELIKYIKEQANKDWREDILTIVWARRWAEYKRPWLIFYDRGWFEWLLNSGKIQMVFAGKPHPADLSMINLWNEVWQMSKKLPNLVILPGYEFALSKLLKGGTDLWLHTPRRPREACGTSWMSAAMNFALAMSSRDGGVLEGITPDNGFLFGVDYPCRTEGEQDARDFADLKQCLQLAMDIFYGDKVRWYKMALAAKKTAEENFSSDRMLRDYISHLYT